MISFYNPVRLFFGSGIAAKIAEVANLSGARIVVITDSPIAETDYFAHCVERLAAAGCEVLICDKATSEASYESVNKCFRLLVDFEPDHVLGVGGGSVMDVAKCVSIMLDSRISDVRLLLRPQSAMFSSHRDLILVPTTAGTGSEVTRGVVIEDDNCVKQGIGGGHVYARVGIVDPLFTRSMPDRARGSALLDALCHSIEAYLSSTANPISDMYAKRSIEAIIRNSLAGMENPDDVECWEELSLASTLSALAFTSGAGIGWAHEIGHSIAYISQVDVCHGHSVAMTICEGLRLCEHSSDSRVVNRLNCLNSLVKTNTNNEFLDLISFLSKLKSVCKVPKLRMVIEQNQLAATRDSAYSVNHRITSRPPEEIERILISAYQEEV